MIDIMLLGTGGTIPLPSRALSSLLVRIGQEMLLFDCGEGTQINMRRYGWGFKTLSTLCLSHLHADHVAGLPGILLTVGNAGRTEPMSIIGPVGTQRAVAGLLTIAPHLPYTVEVHELAGGEELAVHGARLATTALDHHIPCLGFRLDVSRARRFDPERARTLGVPVLQWKTLQQGQPVEVDGRTVEPDAVLGAARRGLRLAYVTDTRPTPDLPGFVAGADLLVCEGTYGDPADAVNAVQNRHMLFSEAAQIAREGQVRHLWLTHFSATMLDPDAYAEQATQIFPATTVAHDGISTSLHFDDDT
jgi:ribonuclease Z